MARQSTTPVSFNKTTRKDTAVTMTSGRAGVVVPLGYIPLLPGDSCSGRVGLDVQLAEMPRPLLNAVTANFQAWFVPKEAMPHYASKTDVMHAFTQQPIKTLEHADRAPRRFFPVLSQAATNEAAKSAFMKALGLHFSAGVPIHTDLMNAFVLIYNFRLAAHSSRLTRRKYADESVALATVLPRAFWPSSRLSRVVPDYERALVVGSLDLDVIAGRLPINGIAKAGTGLSDDLNVKVQTKAGTAVYRKAARTSSNNPTDNIVARTDGTGRYLDIFAEMSGQSMTITLADIDKARTTQAFAKLRTSYAGNDATGFDNDDAIVAMLMQGLPVDADQFKRPWLLDSKRVPVGFAERFATDSGGLDKSVTQGRASATLSLNVPSCDFGGVILYTVEILPERVDERMSDEWLYCHEPDDLPNALRDVQRVEPVDLVKNRRVDARHTKPAGLYGYEPMNDKWNRDFTRLGGVFYQAKPGAGFKEARANIWQTEIVNPTFSGTHYLAPYPFPHDVFSDQKADAFEVVARHAVSIVGLTQIGDVLAENSSDYNVVANTGE